MLSVIKSKSPEHRFVPAMIPDFSSTELTLRPELPFSNDKKKERKELLYFLFNISVFSRVIKQNLPTTTDKSDK